MYVNWEAVIGVGTFVAVGVALFLGTTAILSQKRERKENLQRISKNTKRLKFQIGSELVILKERLNSEKRKSAPQKDIIGLGPIVPTEYIETLNKLEVFLSQSELLDVPTVVNLELIVFRLKLLSYYGTISKTNVDKVLGAIEELEKRSH